MSGFNIDQFKEHLRWAEGVRSKPYRDSEENWTVGVGRLLSKGLSDDEIEHLLHNDVAESLGLCKRLEYWSDLSWPRTLVVADMAFNMGPSFIYGWPKFHAAMALKDYKLAANEMVDSRWFHQVGRRSPRMVRVMRTGVLEKPKWESSKLS